MIKDIKSFNPIEAWRSVHYSRITHYCEKSSFIANIPPQVAVQLSPLQTLEILKRKLGNEVFFKCLDPGNTISSPVANEPNGNWLKTSKLVGVNIRTIDSFFNLVKYCFTLSQEQDTIHILPIWEPGVVSSLYGKVSWQVNNEFYSHELERVQPHLNNVQKQLKVTINFLHALGKKVGMDVIPHSDRFSEMTINQPSYFEWVKLDKAQIVEQDDDTHKKVEQIIFNYLKSNGLSEHNFDIGSPEEFFQIDDQLRNEALFGYNWDSNKRQRRRIEILQKIKSEGYETLPMTMAPPYRGISVDPENFEIDEYGYKWYNYKFDQPQEMSRVFGPLTRYKFYHLKKNSWELNFNKPNKAVWEYLAQSYASIQKEFNFDFMRGDMAHVQPRPNGVPSRLTKYYDPLKYVKSYISKNHFAGFAFYAETFLTHDNFMSYGNEAQHLDAIEADATLGDLQSTIFGSNDFVSKLQNYLSLKDNHSFAPSFTVITSDKDDPRFDKFYQTGNIARYFISLFFDLLPSYFSLGFEVRSLNKTRNDNNTYSKLYVFNIKDTEEQDKFTTGPYEWGQNWSQFAEFEKIKLLRTQLNMDSKQTVLGVKDSLIWENDKYYFGVSFTQKPIDKEILKLKKNLKVVYLYSSDFPICIYEKC